MRFLLFLFKKVLTSTKCCSFLVLGDTKFKIAGYLFRQNNKLCKHISFFCRNICTIDFFVVPLHRILITTIFVTTFFVIIMHMENPFKFGSIVEDEFFTDRFELEDPFFGEWLVAKH